eukprot:m.618811 g.618811  ORF g.618811 m.618811 type:complete len:57 (-) comp58191_c0_seq3:40-210(-)
MSIWRNCAKFPFFLSSAKESQSKPLLTGVAHPSVIFTDRFLFFSLSLFFVCLVCLQ